VVSLVSQGVIHQLLPLHQPDRLHQLKQCWLMNFFGEQPIDLINEYFGTQIAMYFAWLNHMTFALWFPAITG
jgi:anoctamin-8